MKHIKTYKELNEGFKYGKASGFTKDFSNEEIKNHIKNYLENNKRIFNENFSNSQKFTDIEMKIMEVEDPSLNYIESVIGKWSTNDKILIVRKFDISMFPYGSKQSELIKEVEISLYFKPFLLSYKMLSIVFDTFKEAFDFLMECGIDATVLWNKNIPIYYCTDYKCQKKLLDTDPTLINKFKEKGVKINPRIELEYSDLIGSSDLGLF